MFSTPAWFSSFLYLVKGDYDIFSRENFPKGWTGLSGPKLAPNLLNLTYLKSLLAEELCDSKQGLDVFGFLNFLP